MSKFKKWIKEAHPEYLEEGALDYINQNKFLRNAVAGGTMAMGALGAGTASAANPEAKSKVAMTQSADDPDVIEKDGYVYIRGSAKPIDDSPKSKLNASEVAQTKIQLKASKYFASRGGKPNFVPPGYKVVVSPSQFLNGESSYIVWKWKMPN
jgi:hypothetical protein